MPDWDLVSGMSGNDETDDMSWNPSQTQGHPAGSGRGKMYKGQINPNGGRSMGHFDDNEEYLTGIRGTGGYGKLKQSRMKTRVSKILEGVPLDIDIHEVWDREEGHMHYTRDHQAMPLYKMEHKHLMNTIRFLAERFVQNIEAGGSVSQPESMLDALMVTKGERESQLADVKKFISRAYIIMGRYIFEASRRGYAYDAIEMAKPLFDLMNKLAGTGIDNQPIKAIVVKETVKEEEKGEEDNG